MSGPVHCSHQSQWVGVCLLTHTYKNKQALLLFSRPMILTLSQITQAYETFPIKASSEMMWQPLTKTDSESERSGAGSVFPSVFMNEQPVLLCYTSPSCSAFGLVRFEELCFFFSSPSFKVVFIGYCRTYRYAGRPLVSWNNRGGSQRCCLRQAPAEWDTSICLCTHTEEPKNEPK